VTGIAGQLSTVYYSATGSYATWSGAGTGSFNVAQNDGTVCKGIKSFSANELIVFKDSSMWKYIGNSIRIILYDIASCYAKSYQAENYQTSRYPCFLIHSSLPHPFARRRSWGASRRTARTFRRNPSADGALLSFYFPLRRRSDSPSTAWRRSAPPL
jgi:hypothetical protein